MAILKKLSLSGLVERFGQSFRRFPLAMLLMVFLACFLIYLNHGGKPGAKWEFFLIFYPATSALLAVALSLLTEDFKSRLLAIATQVVVHGMWLAASLYLSQFDRFSIPQLLAVSATVVAIGLAVFLICFYRNGYDLRFWNFSIRTVLSVAASVAIGGILTLGLFALVESLKLLFSLHIPDTVFADIASVCMVMLAPALFMNLIPKGEDKYLDAAPEFSGFSKGVVQYLFLPLLGLYMITLYAYAAKILMEWSLPVGGVSYLVTGSMVLMVLLIYITYPIQHQEGNKLFKLVTCLAPVLMLPLLALMTVAIQRRLGDYGITVSRLYLLVFNLWCYAVCLWLIFTRNKRIWLIPASFAAILLFISVGPQSIANVTQRQLLKEARTAFESSGIKRFPLSGEQYDQWLKKADPKTAAAIDSKLDYLQTDFGFNSIRNLVGKDVITGTYVKTGQGDIIVTTNSNFFNSELIHDVEMPQGYHKMSLVDFYIEGVMANHSMVPIHFKVANRVEPNEAIENDDPVVSPLDAVEYQFEVAAKELIERDEERNPGVNVQPLLVENGQAMLMIDRYSFHLWHDRSRYDLSVSGILFTK